MLAILVINPWHMHEGYCSRSVCVCVSVTVLPAKYLFYTLKQGAIRLYVVVTRYALCGFHYKINALQICNR